MKTPREVLLRRHAGMEPQLTAISRQVIGEINSARPEPRLTWRQWLHSLRWHILALGGAWMVILFMNMEQSSETPGKFAATQVPSANQLLAALQEQRRQLSQWGSEQTPPAIAPAPIQSPPSPRSGLQTTNYLNLA